MVASAAQVKRALILLTGCLVAYLIIVHLKAEQEAGSLTGSTAPRMPVPASDAKPQRQCLSEENSAGREHAAATTTMPPRSHPAWPKARVIEAREFVEGNSAVYRRITIVQPLRLPYPVRIEESFRRGPDGDEELLERTEVVANRLLLRIHSDAEKAFLQLIAGTGMQARQLSKVGIYRVDLPNAHSDAIPEALFRLSSDGDSIVYTETDPIVRPAAQPNDPAYTDGRLWGWNNTGQDEGVIGADIDAPEGWDIRTDASAILVGVVDSGIRYTHEDISGNMWVNPGEDGFDAFGNSKRSNGIDDDGNGYIDDVHGIDALDNDGDPMDVYGHGTHLAGTIGAVGNNSIGITGVAWQTKIMALRFIDNGGSVSDAIECLEYAMQQGAHITNNSWGGTRYSQALFDVISAANDAGMLIVAAAGNDSQDNGSFSQYPANFELDNVLAVAATTRTDELAAFSNYGPGMVEIAAPGDAIYSLGIESDDHYMERNGTSMAAPAVSGVAALLAAHFPYDDPVGIKNRMLASARHVPALSGMVTTAGVVNLYAALQTATNAPFNDDWASAFVIPADPSVVRGTTSHATREANELAAPNGGSNSVWYKWKAQTTGTTLASLFGSAFDTVISVYHGSSLADLALIAHNDDFEGATWSRVQWESTKDHEYFIAVSGKGDAGGYLRLTFSGPPVEDHIANALEIPQFPFTYASDNTNSGREVNEPLHASQHGGGSLWLKLRLSDSSRNIILNTRNSEFDTLLAVYASDVTTPTFSDLQLVVANDNAPYGDTFSELRFTAQQNRTYWIATDGKAGARGIVRMRGFTQQQNDDFANAIGLSGNEVSSPMPQGALRGGTREPGEPDHAGAGSESSLWWFWSPASSGDFVLSVDASSAIGVYTGDSIPALASVATGLETSGGVTRLRILNAQPASVYKIAVAANLDAYLPGLITLNIRPSVAVANDSWRRPVALSGMPTIATPFTLTGNNQGATLEGGEPGVGLAASVWYTWTAPASGEFSADTHLSRAMALLNVYETSGQPAFFPSLKLLASGNQNGIDDDAWVRFSAVAGRTYYFQVASPTIDNAGEFKLLIQPFTPPANDDFANAEVLSNFFIQREYPNFGASRQAGEPLHATDNDYHNKSDVTTEISTAYKTLWFKWTAKEHTARRTSFSSFGSNLTTVVAVYEGPRDNAQLSDLVSLVGASSHFGDFWGWGEFNWTPTAGTTYYIAVGSNTPNKEEIHRLSLWQNPNDHFANRTQLSGNHVTLTDANFAATVEPGEPAHITTEHGGRSLWYEWTAPDSGVYIFDTIHSFLEDRFFDLGLNPDRNKSGGRMHMAIYTGSRLSSLFKVASNRAISMRDYNAMIALNAVAGTTYQIAIDSKIGPAYVVNGPKPEWTYRSIFNLNISKGSLSNDAIAHATTIHGDYHQEFIDLKYASRELGEPTHGGRQSRSAWWRWTAPDSATYHAATAGDLFDTQHSRTPGIAVYHSTNGTGSFGDLIKIAEANNNDYSANYIPAQVRFDATEGQTYFIAIDLDSNGISSHKGLKSGLLFAKVPPNDNFLNATEITGSRRTVFGYNVGATEEPGEPDIDPGWKRAGATNSSVWWKWTAPAAGLTSVETTGSHIYAELGVYTGSGIGQLLEIAKETTAGSFDNGFTYQERTDLANRKVYFSAIAGTTYFILVNGSSSQKESRGPITLTISGQPAKPLTVSALQALRLDASRVQLRWIDEAVDEDSYRIERAPDASGPWQEVHHSGTADLVQWTDIEASSAAYYRVRAEGLGGQGDWAVTYIDAPENVTALQMWRARHFATMEPKGLAADNADPDGDELPNKLEFALKSDPLNADAALHSPKTSLRRDGNHWYLEYRYRRLRGAGVGSPLGGYTVDDITYWPQVTYSPTLSTWLTGTEGFEQLPGVVNNHDGTETVSLRVRQPIHANGPFVRLVVE